jgi:hypothetical protein
MTWIPENKMGGLRKVNVNLPELQVLQFSLVEALICIFCDPELHIMIL